MSLNRLAADALPGIVFAAVAIYLAVQGWRAFMALL